jgi:tRNA-2-methylthio-N6-dimethylallyladenosine synthase
LIGQTVEVLVEGPSKTALKHNDSGQRMQLTGRTRTDHIVVFDGNRRLVGHMVQLAVDQATSFTLFGTVITGEYVGSQAAEPANGLTPAFRSHAETGRISLPML